MGRREFSVQLPAIYYIQQGKNHVPGYRYLHRPVWLWLLCRIDVLESRSNPENTFKLIEAKRFPPGNMSWIAQIIQIIQTTSLKYRVLSYGRYFRRAFCPNYPDFPRLLFARHKWVRSLPGVMPFAKFHEFWQNASVSSSSNH